MIEKLIAEYVGLRLSQPYALVINPEYEHEELPSNVFICWSEKVTGIHVMPLEAAKILIHGSLWTKEEAKNGN